MTTIDRVVKRETAVYKRDGGRSRVLVVELHPTHLELRGKGTRRALMIGYDAIYDAAAKMLARAEREEKRLKKKGGAR
jgi:hypothetical protein